MEILQLNPKDDKFNIFIQSQSKKRIYAANA